MVGHLKQVLEVMLLDGEGAPLGGQDLTPFEVAREDVGLHSRRHEDHLELRTQRQQLAEEQDEQVCLRVALMDLIDDDV